MQTPNRGLRGYVRAYPRKTVRRVRDPDQREGQAVGVFECELGGSSGSSRATERDALG